MSVETRVNALGPRSFLLRLGAKAYQVRLAEYVLALLSSTTTNAERAEFAEAKSAHERLLADYKRLSDKAQQFIDLRNEIDRREQLAEEARQRLGSELFARVLELDIPSIQNHAQSLAAAIKKADREQAGLFTQLLWPLFRSGRFAQLGADNANCVYGA